MTDFYVQVCWRTYDQNGQMKCGMRDFLSVEANNSKSALNGCIAEVLAFNPLAEIDHPCCKSYPMREYFQIYKSK